MKEDKTHLVEMMSIKKIIKEEVHRKIFESEEEFNWIKGSNKWEGLLNSMEMLANDRKLHPNENPEVRWKYWTRKDFKIWLGETSEEDFKQLKELAKAKGFRNVGNDNYVLDSLYITVDRDYSKKGDRVVFGVMGCRKEEEDITPGQRYYWSKWSDEEKEQRLCEKVGDEYRIKPKQLEYDRNYFDSRDDVEELFL
jgi:hypothetical protein